MSTQNADSWTSAHTAATYDVVADTYADHLSGTEPEASIDLAMIEHFVTLLPPSPQVLDAGCGAGRLLPYLAERGCALTGIDLSEQMIRRARLDHPSHPTTVGSLTALPYADASFDGVVAWYSMIHSPDDQVAVTLAGARRVLRPGGSVLVASQTGEGMRDVADAYRRLSHDVELMRWGRSVAVMRGLLEEAGFAVTAVMERAA